MLKFVGVYNRALGTLGGDRGTAALLVVLGLAVAVLAFVDPILFGRVIALLAQSGSMSADALWGEAARLLGLWAAVGGAGILMGIATALQTERMAHRNRLAQMARFFGHVLSLPLSFHGETQSGRMMKVMLSGADGLFWLWLTFFREQLATAVSLLVLLPLTLLINWRLALVLIVLVVLFAAATLVVVRRTQAGQQAAQGYQGALAGTAQDALANVVVVQSFTRLAAETRRFGDIVNQVIAQQFPVLNWWAVLNVLTRGASTVAVITIVLVGTWLHVQGRAGVGEIVTFMGFSTLLIGRLDGAMTFFARLFFELPNISEFFGVLDAQSSVPERSSARDLTAGSSGETGRVIFEEVSFAYPGGRTS